MDWEYSMLCFSRIPKACHGWTPLQCLGVTKLKGQSYQTHSRRIKKAQTSELMQFALQDQPLQLCLVGMVTRVSR